MTHVIITANQSAASSEPAPFSSEAVSEMLHEILGFMDVLAIYTPFLLSRYLANSLYKTWRSFFILYNICGADNLSFSMAIWPGIVVVVVSMFASRNAYKWKELRRKWLLSSYISLIPLLLKSLCVVNEYLGIYFEKLQNELINFPGIPRQRGSGSSRMRRDEQRRTRSRHFVSNGEWTIASKLAF